jgi:hypothetical protein
MRLRRRRIVKANREWVNRPGGWAQDGAITEEGAATKCETLIDHINPCPDALSRSLKLYFGACQNGS